MRREMCYNAQMPQKAKQSKRRAARKKAAPVDRLTRAENILAENAKAMAELRKENAKARAEENKRRAEEDKRRAEEDKRRAKEDKRRAKERAEVKKEMAELRAHIRKVSAHADRAIAAGDRAVAAGDKALKVAEKNNQYISGHANGEGEILEIECYNALWKMRKLNGVKLDGLRLGVNDPHYGVEIDLVGVNGKFTFPMEVKRTLEPSDVRRFNEVQVERFKKAYPELAVDKQVTPVVIFALRKKRKNAKGEKEDPVQLALDAGMVVLQSTGENQLSPVTDPEQVVTRTHKDD